MNFTYSYDFFYKTKLLIFEKQLWEFWCIRSFAHDKTENIPWKLAKIARIIKNVTEYKYTCNLKHYLMC